MTWMWIGLAAAGLAIAALMSRAYVRRRRYRRVADDALEKVRRHEEGEGHDHL